MDTCWRDGARARRAAPWRPGARPHVPVCPAGPRRRPGARPGVPVCLAGPRRRPGRGSAAARRQGREDPFFFQRVRQRSGSVRPSLLFELSFLKHHRSHGRCTIGCMYYGCKGLIAWPWRRARAVAPPPHGSIDDVPSACRKEDSLWLAPSIKLSSVQRRRGRRSLQDPQRAVEAGPVPQEQVA